jgi:hypothetical protein
MIMEEKGGVPLHASWYYIWGLISLKWVLVVPVILVVMMLENYWVLMHAPILRIVL